MNVRLSLFPSHVGNEEDDAEHDAEGANNDVADGEEVVGATENVGGGENEVLAAGKGVDLVSIPNFESVFTLLHILVNLSPQFAEVRETGGSHPDDEVLVLDIDPLLTLPVL